MINLIRVLIKQGSLLRWRGELQHLLHHVHRELIPRVHRHDCSESGDQVWKSVLAFCSHHSSQSVSQRIELRNKTWKTPGSLMMFDEDKKLFSWYEGEWHWIWLLWGISFRVANPQLLFISCLFYKNLSDLPSNLIIWHLQFWQEDCTVLCSATVNDRDYFMSPSHRSHEP